MRKNDDFPVKLRKRETKNGFSLYLQYSENGRTFKRYLGLKLLNGSTAQIKAYNTNIMEQAKAEQTKCIMEHDKEQMKQTARKGKCTIWRVFNELIEEKKRLGFSISIINQTKSTQKRLMEYCQNDSLLLSKIDAQFIEEFLLWCRSAKAMHNTINGATQTSSKTICNNTINGYYKCLRNALNFAVQKRYIKETPLKYVRKEYKPTYKNPKRAFLDVEELKAIEAVSYKAFIQHNGQNELVKRAFLFACYCGLRYSDICRLSTKHLQRINGQIYIIMDMQKTDESIMIPLGSKALSLLGEADENGKYFTLPTLPTCNWHLSRIAKRANIEKHITFHTSRHTFATTLLTLGADIYTTSKLLGHTSVKTTQIYADIVEEKKQTAISLFDKL